MDGRTSRLNQDAAATELFAHSGARRHVLVVDGLSMGCLAIHVE
jgi:hypothetical protein